MKTRFFAAFLCMVLLLSGCADRGITQNESAEIPQSDSSLGDGNKTFGEDIEDTGAYDGYFEGESSDISIEWVSGTKSAYKLEGTTLTFTEISEETVYSVSGTFKGNIVIDVGDGYKFDLELRGFSLVCDTVNPITVKSGEEVAVKAKKDTKNYIYDMREAVDTEDESLFSGAIHAETDLEISGKGALYVVSENNNGIHTKDDLQVKNLTLFVACIDNSLKGNDSVEIERGNTILIASGGDCIKTSNSKISEKGKQRGSVTIAGGTHTLYAACDGIDAAYNVIIDDDGTALNIYTDKYSNYSKEVTANDTEVNYIRFTSNKYYYSVKYYNSDTDYLWVNAEYHSKVSGGRTTYYYYSYPKTEGYEKLQFFIYESQSLFGQDKEYLVASEYLTPNKGCDTIAFSSRGNGISYTWTNYNTKVQEGGFGGGPGGPGGGGPGGFGEGNSDKGEYSTKGIKAANEIVINAGVINIKSYDDAVHANNDILLENGESPLGNITVEGGTVNVYSNDDGLHADGALIIKTGTVTVANSYEGLEGAQVGIAGGYVSIYSDDDGINATAESGAAVEISGGTLYIYCTGDGIDSNSRTSGKGIVFSGGNTVVISNSGMNSALDTEKGYTYEAGTVLAVMPRGGMANEAVNCNNFSSIGKYIQTSVTSGSFLVAEVGETTVTVKMPVSLNALIVVLGDNTADIAVEASVNYAQDENGVSWKRKGM